MQRLRFDVARTIEKLRLKLEKMESDVSLLEIPSKLPLAVEAAEQENIRQAQIWGHIKEKFQNLRLMIIHD